MLTRAHLGKGVREQSTTLAVISKLLINMDRRVYPKHPLSVNKSWSCYLLPENIRISSVGSLTASPRQKTFVKYSVIQVRYALHY